MSSGPDDAPECTYICTLLMTVPNRPTMPRNSSLLRFFTVYSWHTLDTAYSAALSSTKPSPSKMLEAERRNTHTVEWTWPIEWAPCVFQTLPYTEPTNAERSFFLLLQIHRGTGHKLYTKSSQSTEHRRSSYWTLGLVQRAGQPPPWPPHRGDRCRQLRSGLACSVSSESTRTGGSGPGSQNSPAAGGSQKQV